MAQGRTRQLVAGTCGCGQDARCGCVVIDSAGSTVILSLLGPVLLASLAVFWIVSGAPWWVPGLVALAAVVMAVVLYDMPVSAVFSEDGVTRRTPLRDHLLVWSDIDSIILTGSSRNPGLAARVGRRNYLLADRSGLDTDQLGMLQQMRPSS